MNVIICGIKVLRRDVFYFLIVCSICIFTTNCRSINRLSLPKIPDVVHPPIPGTYLLF